MKAKTLLIVIHLDKNITKSDLDLRHLLVGTIENRNLGEVVEETSSPEMMEVAIEVSGENKIEDDLQSLLISLGFNDFSIQEINENDE